MGNEAVYRERFDNVLRVVGQVVAGGGQHNGRFLDLTTWDGGPGNGACIMGLCSHDEWFQAHGFVPADGGTAYGLGAPRFMQARGGAAVANFLDIDKLVFEALFCVQGYCTGPQLGVTPKRVRDRIAEYIGYRFEGRTCSPHLMMYLQMSEADKKQQQVPVFLQVQPTAWMSMEFVGAGDTVTFTSAPPSMSYYVGSQLMTVPAIPTSPPFTLSEVAQFQHERFKVQMEMMAAHLPGMYPPNIKPPVSMSEVINAMMANA